MIQKYFPDLKEKEVLLPSSGDEQAAKEYGAPTVSLGSAGGYVENFYIDCGY